MTRSRKVIITVADEQGILLDQVEMEVDVDHSKLMVRPAYGFEGEGPREECLGIGTGSQEGGA